MHAVVATLKKRNSSKREENEVSAESQFHMTFPFTDLNIEEQRIKTCNFECALFCREINSQPCLYMDELLNAFTLLESSRHLPLNRLFFVDCLSSGGIACMLALSSRFGKALGIEVSEETKVQAEETLNQVCRLFPENAAMCKTTFKVGSFFDYMPVDADVIFLDGTVFSTHVGILDETVVIKCLLDTALRLLKPVTLIIVSIFMQLDQLHLRRLQYPQITCIYQRHKQHRKDYNLWMLQVSKE